MKIRNQVVTESYALYNGDSCQVLPQLKNESIGFSIFSPPFSDLYSYSDEIEDVGNCPDYKSFFEHFGFIVDELQRVMLPGRIVAVHCMDLPTHKSNGEEIGLREFPEDIIRCFKKRGFIFHARCCIWKDPLIAATRTKAIGLAHKQIVKDSALTRMGIADFLFAFRKKGENPVPIAHPRGLETYYGSRSVPTKFDKYLSDDGVTHRDDIHPQLNKRSQWIWQQFASPVWFDIRQTKVLPFRGAKDEDDARHICPFAIDVVERSLILWSAQTDIVLDPFSGIGTTVYTAVKSGRKGIGIELKPRYHRQAVKNVEIAVRKAKGLTEQTEEDND